MQKIDIHIHLTRWQLPRMKKIFISSGKNMLPHLDALGIRCAVLMSGGEKKTFFATNAGCAAVCKKHPERYRWMCNVDAVNPETLPSRLALYKANGAVGVGELTLHRRLDDAFLQALFAAAQELQMPVLIHMSPSAKSGYGVIDEPGLPFLEQTLKAYPNLIIIGHSQPFWHEISADASPSDEARNGYGKGPIAKGGRVCELLDRYPNLYADLSANSGSCAIMRDEEFGIDFLNRYQNRLMFGTDMLNIEMEFPLANWLDKLLHDGKLSEQAYRKICVENACRVLHINCPTAIYSN